MIGKKITSSVIASPIGRSNLLRSWGWLRRCFTTLRNDISLLFIFSLLISSCSTGTTSPPTPQVVSVYSSFAAEPWLSELYDCAARQSNVALSRVDDPNSAEIVLQIGEPEFLSLFAYQIDNEEILIVTQRQSPVQNLTLEDARALFMGLGDPSVQVWVYASEEDV